MYYSRPGPNDLQGRDFDSAGRLTASLLAELKPPPDADAYMCGPTAFMDEISAALGALGFDASRIHDVRHTGTEPAVSLHVYSPPQVTLHWPSSD